MTLISKLRRKCYAICMKVDSFAYLNTHVESLLDKWQFILDHVNRILNLQSSQNTWQGITAGI
jgi:hypothetical protein